MADLRNMTLAEAEAFAQDELGEPRFRGEQMWRWAHEHGVTGFAAMSNVSKKVREGLDEKLQIGTLRVAEVQTSMDGTRKMRLLTRDNRSIEAMMDQMDALRQQAIALSAEALNNQRAA